MRWTSPSLLGIVGIAVLLISINVAISQAPWFNWVNNALSDLGNLNRGNAAIFNVGLLSSGFLIALCFDRNEKACAQVCLPLGTYRIFHAAHRVAVRKLREDTLPCLNIALRLAPVFIVGILCREEILSGTHRHLSDSDMDNSFPGHHCARSGNPGDCLGFFGIPLGNSLFNKGI